MNPHLNVNKTLGLDKHLDLKHRIPGNFAVSIFHADWDFRVVDDLE